LSSPRPPLLQVETLACARGERTLFSALSFEMHEGELLRVTGANGAGKTTLLRTLCALSEPTEGSVRWRSEPIGHAREEYWRELAYLGHVNALKDDLDPIENLVLGLALQGQSVTRVQAEQALADAGLAHCAGLPVRDLSQGQRRRVALARLALCKARSLWVLDEPFTALDAEAVGRVAQLMAGHLSAGGLVIYTTHQDVPVGSAPARTLDLESCRA
jgi:heme exporter protein A